MYIVQMFIKRLEVTSWALKALILLELYEKYKLMTMHLSDKWF